MATISDRIKAYLNFSNISQAEFGQNAGRSAGWVNNAGKSLKIETADLIKKHYPDLNIEWLVTGNGEMLISRPRQEEIISLRSISGQSPAELEAWLEGLKEDLPDEPKKVTYSDIFGEYELPEKLDNTDKLAEIIARKKKPQQEPSSKVVNESDLVDAKEILVPIAGQAGLSSNIYPEELLEEFEVQTIKVRPSERGIFYLIEVNGNSMPPLIQHGDWLRCEEISKLFWKEAHYFKPEKIYCIWHNTRGIVFKRIVYRELGRMFCVSDNEDKKEYPDFELHLEKCTKILKVVELAKRKF